jgi:hypothetical protein
LRAEEIFTAEAAKVAGKIILRVAKDSKVRIRRVAKGAKAAKEYFSRTKDAKTTPSRV